MKCPVCGKEMTAGMLQSARAVYFADENYEHLLFRPNEHMALLTRDNFTGPTGTAWRCADCKKSRGGLHRYSPIQFEKFILI